MGVPVLEATEQPPEAGGVEGTGPIDISRLEYERLAPTVLSTTAKPWLVVLDSLDVQIIQGFQLSLKFTAQ